MNETVEEERKVVKRFHNGCKSLWEIPDIGRKSTFDRAIINRHCVTSTVKNMAGSKVLGRRYRILLNESKKDLRISTPPIVEEM